jgi:hypothetical protein
MKFRSKWITTQTFADLTPINVYHKERAYPELPKSEYTNVHTHFRKRLTYSGNGVVTMRISADDYYKLYINGHFVAQGPAPSYIENYRYNELDITPYLQQGENMIAVHVYYQGLINRAWVSGDNRQGMIADLFVDGEYLCGTDETWKWKEAPEYSGGKYGYDSQFVENIDFTKKEVDWKLLSSSDEGYANVVAYEEYAYDFREEAAVLLDVYEIKPQEIVHVREGVWFMDFGTEITGVFSMKIQGEPGQKVRVLCGEELDANEPYMARYKMRCNCCYEDELTLSGGMDEVEFYEYKAFRYVNVVTDNDCVDPSTFCAIVRHHPYQEVYRFHSDIPHLDEIWKLCANSVKWGVQEGYLDCPSREKGQYLGDFTVSGLAHLYVTGDSAHYKKALYDFASSAMICKGLMCIAPCSQMQEIGDFSLQYPLQILNYYRYTDDLQAVQELYPVAKGIIEYFEQFEREDGLLDQASEKWNIVDWPVNLRDAYEFGAGKRKDHDGVDPCHNVLNAYYIGAIQNVAQIQEILGEDAKVYREKADRLKEAFLKVFYDPEKKLFRDNPDSEHHALHANALPVFSGIAPAESYDAIKALIMEKGLACGVQFSYFVLKALAKMGAYEEELALLVNESEHSWVNMLREGATTTFEAWGKDQKRNTSLCHPWACAPVIVLVEDLADLV